MAKTSNARNMIHSLLWDVGAPLIVFYPLHMLGVSTVAALTAAVSVALGRILFVAVRDRHFSGFAALMAVMFGIDLVLTLATGDPRIMLAKDSVTTGVIGLAFLGSCVIGKPLMLAMVRRSLPPEQQADAEERARANPEYRRRLVVLSVVWGAILFTEALLRVVLVFTLPVDVMIGLSRVLQVAAVGLAMLWSIVYGRRAKRQAALAGAAR